jgi:hypothetical protein
MSLSKKSTPNVRDIIERSLNRKEFYDSKSERSYRITAIYTGKGNSIYVRVSYTNGDRGTEEGIPLARHLSASEHNYTDLGELDFPVRIITGLKRAYEVRTLDDVCNLTEEDILRTRSLGKVSLAWIKDFLAQQGLKLKDRSQL